MRQYSLTEENKMNEDEMNKRINFWKAVSIVLLVALSISIIYPGMEKREKLADVVPVNAVLANGEVNMEGIKALGDPNAPVVMVEYSDFECPYCQRHYVETFSEIKEQYIDTGKVYYVFKHYPLGFHKQAIPAALAAECANEQGRFWEYHDVLYKNGVQGGEAAYKTYAKEMDLKVSVFNDCLDKKKYSEVVQVEFEEGKKLGIKGTPGFIINGQIVSGAQPFSIFASIIEDKLAPQKD